MGLGNVVISRTDSIGDVMLTLPMAGLLKSLDPTCKIYFLGKGYTKDVIEACEHIDNFLNSDELNARNRDEKLKFFSDLSADTILHVFPNNAIAKLAKRAQIPLRIGTSRRYFHWLTCNKLVFVKRRNSPYHETQLNCKLLEPFGIEFPITREDVPGNYGISKIDALDERTSSLIDSDKYNLIIHPKSKGNAREWGVDNFSKLIMSLPEDRYKIFITGTVEEANIVSGQLPFNQPNVVNLMGKLTLKELLSFIKGIDGIVAASTGPLHIAAALGKDAIGLYAPLGPLHPRRWGPLGKKGKYFLLDKECSTCKKDGNCECIRSIDPKEVKDYIDSIIMNN